MDIMTPNESRILKGVNKDMAEDNVNHPKHYTQYHGLEVIDLTEQLNFNKGNAVKYLTRAGLKDPNKEIEDLEKAAWYTNREIERVKEEQRRQSVAQYMSTTTF